MAMRNNIRNLPTTGKKSSSRQPGSDPPASLCAGLMYRLRRAMRRWEKSSKARESSPS